MSKRLHYGKTVRPELLLDELQTALPALAPQPGPSGENVPQMALEATDTECWVTVPDATVTADVDAVVAAHDPGRVTPADAQQAADRGNVKALAQLVDNMVPRLEQIQADMAIIESSTPPATVNLATLQAMAKATRDEAKAIGDLAQGSERILKALDGMIRQLYGQQD